MNKIKLLYDVVTTLKDKETLTGVIKAAICKEQVTLFSLQNEFAKNLLTGQTKAKISTGLDYEGKKVQHESTTEFTMPGHCHHRHHEFFKHIHHHAGQCGGIKGKLSKLAFALSILNSLQVEEQEQGTIVVSLNMNEVPEDMKEMLREKMSHARAHHEHHGFMKEFCTMEACDFTFTMLVNKKHEIEKIAVTLAGTQRDEQHQPHDLTAIAELRFSW
jgi:hypothetical protein